MRVGDLARWNKKTVVITEIYLSKCWRTDAYGTSINWGRIDPEPFARILVNGELVGVPQLDLEPLDEA